MKKRLSRHVPRAWLLCSLLFVGFACAPGDEDTAGEELAENGMADAASQAAWLDDYADRYERHYNAGHADSIAAMYAEDAVLLAADGSVAMGRSAIAAWNAGQMAQGSPQLAVSVIDRKAVGDTVLAIGSYTVSSTPEGAEPVEFGGYWMAAYGATPNGWKTLGLIANYDRQMSAEYLQGALPTEPPPDESTVGDMLSAYETAWNAGNAQGVADLYAEDAWAALINLPALEGREAIARAMEQRIAGSQIALKGARTVDLGNGWKVDGGMVEITRDDGDDVRGHYWVLLRTGDDGEQLIQWALSNGRPVSVIPSGTSR